MSEHSAMVETDSSGAPSLSHSLQAIRAILHAHGVQEASLFGSFARGDARPESDVDLLITAPAGLTLFGLASIQLELEDALGRRVDIVTHADLHPGIREQALRSQKSILP